MRIRESERIAMGFFPFAAGKLHDLQNQAEQRLHIVEQSIHTQMSIPFA
jgi:hypothetical protein